MLKDNIKYHRKRCNLTLEEVGNYLGVGRATVQKYESGLISNVPYENIIKMAELFKIEPAVLMGWQNDSIPSPSITEDYVTFPVLYDVAAGFDKMAQSIDEWEGETIDIPLSYIHGKKDDYAVIRVKGDSMYPDYKDGDRVLLKKQPTLDYSGQVGVLVYDDCATIKRVDFVSGEDWLIMRPINPNFPPQRLEGSELEHCRIVGVPKVLVRKIKD